MRASHPTEVLDISEHLMVYTATMSDYCSTCLPPGMLFTKDLFIIP